MKEGVSAEPKRPWPNVLSTRTTDPSPPAGKEGTVTEQALMKQFGPGSNVSTKWEEARDRLRRYEKRLVEKKTDFLAPLKEKGSPCLREKRL